MLCERCSVNGAASFAVGEVEALVLKAYRGAGFSWGMAQEAGKAAGWLTANRMPSIDLFATLLSQTAGQAHAELAPDNTVFDGTPNWVSHCGLLCPVVSGVLLSDSGAAFFEQQRTIAFVSVPAPLILLPFVAALSLPAVVLKISDLEVWVVDGVVMPYAETGGVVFDTQNVILELADPSAYVLIEEPWAVAFSKQPPVARGVGKVESVALLDKLAQRTTVPATAASRESGAGAGIADDE